MPEVSVIMPTYNAAKYLREAVDSILAQTFKDFELIIIDNCSIDETAQILASYTDSRVRVLKNEKNMERSFSKNRGIAEAQAEIIAFLDADDYAVPKRLAIQLDFLKANPNISLCSCFSKIMGTNEVATSVTEPDDIKAALLLGCPISQTGVMLRKSVLQQLDELFRDEPILAEDYDLWARLSCLPGVEFAIIPLPLVHYRLANTNPKYFEKQRLAACFAYRAQLEAFGLYFNAEQFFIHRILASQTKIENSDQLDKAEDWLKKILQHNLEVNYYNQAALLKSVKRAWFHFCHRSSKSYIQAAFKYYTSEFTNKDFRGAKATLRMLAKSFYFKFIGTQKS